MKIPRGTFGFLGCVAAAVTVHHLAVETRSKPVVDPVVHRLTLDIKEFAMFSEDAYNDSIACLNRLTEIRTRQHKHTRDLVETQQIVGSLDSALRRLHIASDLRSEFLPVLESVKDYCSTVLASVNLDVSHSFTIESSE